MSAIKAKNATLAHLRASISHLEGFHTESLSDAVRLGVEEIDNSFPQGCFPRGAIHEFMSQRREDSAATWGFAASLLHRLNANQNSVVWITKKRSLFPQALLDFGLVPDRILFVELAREQEILWASEEALRLGGLAAVITELPDVTLTATRRLQLAAEQSGISGFLLRENPRKQTSSACFATWQVKSAPSALDDGLPGIGFLRWYVELNKIRNGRPGNWLLEWRDQKYELIRPLYVPKRQQRPFSLAG